MAQPYLFLLIVQFLSFTLEYVKAANIKIRSSVIGTSFDLGIVCVVIKKLETKIQAAYVALFLHCR